MDALYHQTNKQLHETQSNLVILERLHGKEAEALESKMTRTFETIDSNLDRLDIIVNKEPPVRRQNAKYRVDQLKYDRQHMYAAFQHVLQRKQRKQDEERQREDLLSRKFEPNDYGQTSILMDESIQHNQALHRANKGLDDMLDGGETILTNLRDQRANLKGAHKKLLDLANTLGLSNTVMRLIEKRSVQDRLILYAGMFITVVVMYLVYRYFT